MKGALILGAFFALLAAIGIYFYKKYEAFKKTVAGENTQLATSGELMGFTQAQIDQQGTLTTNQGVATLNIGGTSIQSGGFSTGFGLPSGVKL